MAAERPSANWAEFDDSDSNADEPRTQIQTLLSTADFEFLQNLALLTRFGRDKVKDSGISCAIDRSKFALGFNNLVLEVAFSDNAFWIARTPYRPSDPSTVDEDTADLSSEIATMRLVKSRTSIPVPEVFAYDVSPHNDFGYPYILMEYLAGHALKGTLGSQVPSQYLPKVATQLAEVLFQLQGLAFSQLGRIGLGGDIDDPPVIIPANNDAPGSLTPQTSLEWFYMQRQEDNRRALESHSQDPEWKTACWVLKTAIPHIITEARVHGPFPLCHLDLHHGNLLFDNDFNLKGVIDWNGAETVPMERLVVSPEFMTFPAGSDEVNENILRLRSLIRQQLQRLEEAEPVPDDTSPTRLSEIFGSNRADITHRCTYSFPHRALWDGRMVAGLIYGEAVTWEQLVRVYGEMDII